MSNDMTTGQYPLGGLKYMDDASFLTLWPEFQAFANSLGFARWPLNFKPNTALAYTRKYVERKEREKGRSDFKLKPRTYGRGVWKMKHFTPMLLLWRDKDFSNPDAKDGLYGPYGSCLFRKDVAVSIGFSRPMHREFWEVQIQVGADMGLNPEQEQAWQALLQALLAAPRYDHSVLKPVERDVVVPAANVMVQRVSGVPVMA